MKAVKKSGKSRAERDNDRAVRAIDDSGWDLTRIRAEDHGRFVARKRIIEEDHSITLKYESSYVLADLARAVVRREAEAA